MTTETRKKILTYHSLPNLKNMLLVCSTKNASSIETFKSLNRKDQLCFGPENAPATTTTTTTNSARYNLSLSRITKIFFKSSAVQKKILTEMDQKQ